MKRDGTWETDSVVSGADPDEYHFPFEIPQDVEHGKATAEALDAVFKKRRE